MHIRFCVLTPMQQSLCHLINAFSPPIRSQGVWKSDIAIKPNKISLWLVYGNYQSLINVLVSTFLCTVYTGAWRSGCTCSLTTQIFDKTFMLLQPKSLLMTSCKKVNNVLYLLVFLTCIMFLCYIPTAISISCNFTFFWITFFHVPCPLIMIPRNDATFLIMCTTQT